MDEKWQEMEGGKKLLEYLANIKQKRNVRSSDIEVGIGDMKTGRNPSILITRNLGSCVGIALYDKSLKIGALLHIKLPEDHHSFASDIFSEIEPVRTEQLTAYADTCIPIAIFQLQQMGASIPRLTAKMAGGAAMFPIDNPSLNIGQSNVAVSKRLLKRYGIPVLGESTGADYGRTMAFNTENGEVFITTGTKDPVIL